MGLFDNAAEQERKANLKKLEDKRLAFAQELEDEGEDEDIEYVDIEDVDDLDDFEYEDENEAE